MQGNYNFYFMQMRKHRNGSISLETFDPYKDFKAKIKEQIINKEIKEND